MVSVLASVNSTLSVPSACVTKVPFSHETATQSKFLRRLQLLSMFHFLEHITFPNWVFLVAHFMHQSIPPAPSPPGKPRGICQPCQSRGRGFSQFSASQGPGIGQPRAFDTHVLNFKTWSTWRIYEIKISSLWRIGLSSKG